MATHDVVGVPRDASPSGPVVGDGEAAAVALDQRGHRGCLAQRRAEGRGVPAEPGHDLAAVMKPSGSGPS